MLRVVHADSCFFVMLSVIILNVIALSVVMINVVMHSVILVIVKVSDKFVLFQQLAMKNASSLLCQVSLCLMWLR
jgi:hypothetical protein